MKRILISFTGFGILITTILTLLILVFSPQVFASQGFINVNGPGSISLCSTSIYTITVQNPETTRDLCSIVVTNVMPITGFSYIFGSTDITLPDASHSYIDSSQSANNLTWNFDSILNYSFKLHPGESLTIRFAMLADCSAASGTNGVRVDYVYCDNTSTLLFDTSSMGIEVMPGAVIITKTPNSQSAGVGDDVSWSITAENTGLGDIKNVVITDTLGTGLDYQSSSPAGIDSGGITIWSSAEVPALAQMAPGEKVILTLNARVISCQGLENSADVKWGCDSQNICFDTSIAGGTATGAIVLLYQTPLLVFDPPLIQITYCSQQGVTITMPIKNEGDGCAKNIQIMVDMFPMVVTNVQNEAVYNGTSFVLPYDLAPGETFNLIFDVNLADWCKAPAGGKLIYKPHYLDCCLKDFFPPAKLGAFVVGTGGSLKVTKTGPDIVYVGQTNIHYTISADYVGPTSCTGNSASPVTVTDYLPQGFILQNGGGGIYDTVNNTLTWAFDPSINPHFSANILLDAPLACDQCYTVFINRLEAGATDCCGCPLSANIEKPTALECLPPGTSAQKTVQPAVVEKCRNLTYTNDYIFNSASLGNVPFKSLIFTDQAEHQQIYVNGTASVTIDGSPISFTLITGGSPGDPLIISKIDPDDTYASINGHHLVITYQMDTSQSLPVPPCGSPASFYSWSTLDLGQLPDPLPQYPCGSGGSITHQVALVKIEPPAMSVSIAGIPDLIEECGTYNILVTVKRTSSTAVPYDARLILDKSNYYIPDTDAIIYAGVPYTAFGENLTDYEWQFADGFASGDTATMVIPIVKKCAGTQLDAQVYFDDLCHDNTTYDNICSASASVKPELLLSGNIFVIKTPEVVRSVTNMVDWTIYVVNGGAGTAYNVAVQDVLGPGLVYVSSGVGPGVTNTPGVPPNGVTWVIPSIPPGGRSTITLHTRIIACDGLTDQVTVNWGCSGESCQHNSSDTATALPLASNLVSTALLTSPQNLCATQQAVVTLRNAGQANDYDISVKVTLPTGLQYVPGGSQYRVNGGIWNPAPDPVPTSSPLLWSYSQGASGLYGFLSELPVGATLDIGFPVTANCAFNGGTMDAVVDYHNPCGQSQPQSKSHFFLEARRPQLSVTKTQIDPNPTTHPSIACGSNVQWRIDVRNTGAINIPMVWVEDTVGTGFSTILSTSGGDDGGFIGYGGNLLKATWELTGLGVGQTAQLFITAQSTSTSGTACNDVSDTVKAYSGCGEVDHSSETKPGIDSPDEAACLVSVPVTYTLTGKRTPALSISAQILPSSIDTCSGSTTLTYTITNTDPASYANTLDFRVRLPSGLQYISGSTVIHNPAEDLFDNPFQSISGGNTDLYWYETNNPSSNSADLLGPGQSFTVQFQVRATGCFTGANIQSWVYYYNCCNTQANTTITRRINANTPQLSLSRSPTDILFDCFNQDQPFTWTVTVTNTGLNADVVRLEETLGANLVWVSGGTSMGGNKYGWEFGPLASDQSQSFTITALLIQPQNNCAASIRTLSASSYWGCLKPGAQLDGDPMTTAEWQCSISGPQTSSIVRIPDLLITSLQPSVSCNNDSLAGDISIKIKNNGDGTAPPNFKISVQDDAGWSDVHNYPNSLAAGAEATIIIPWNPGCGMCSLEISAKIDHNNTVCECNESNNILYVIYDLTRPDLTILSVIPEVKCTNSTVDVLVKNIGCGPISAGAIVAISGDFITQSTTANTLNPGESETVKLFLGDLQCGRDYSIKAEIDRSNLICECRGDNNSESALFQAPCPDCSITADSVCAGTAGNTAVSNTSAASYIWAVTGGEITDGQGTNTITYTAGNGPLITIQLTVVDDSRCSASCSKNVIVYNLPTGRIVTDPFICEHSIKEAAVIYTDAVTYTWTVNGGEIIYGQGTPNIRYWADSSPYVDISVLLQNAERCFIAPSVRVNVNLLPDCTVTAHPPISVICPDGKNNTVLLTAPLAPWGKTYTYLWMPGGETSSSIQVSPTTSTRYKVTVTDTATGCSSTCTKYITVYCQVVVGGIVEYDNSFGMLIPFFGLATLVIGGGFILGFRRKQAR